MDDFDLVDVSDNIVKENHSLIDLSENVTLTDELDSEKENEKKDDISSSINVTKNKDKFIIGVYISLIVLVLLTLIIYFFGYDLFKSIIKV